LTLFEVRWLTDENVMSNLNQHGQSPSEEEMAMDIGRERDDEAARPKVEKGDDRGRARPKLDKASGKKAAKPGRFIGGVLLLANGHGYENRVGHETAVALSRCLDELANNIAQACSAFTKPIPEDDTGHEAQMLTGALAYNAIFSRIPSDRRGELCGSAVQKILDRFWDVDTMAGAGMEDN
jgi:hypothetical protein